MESNISIQEARNFASLAHANQRYGEHPYTVHLDDVYSVLREAGVTETEHLLPAYLHDILEDTPVTVERLQALGLSDLVIEAVQFCTDEWGNSRKARKAATYARVRQVLATKAPGAGLGVLVKFADRIANIRACLGENEEEGNPGLLEMYLKESPAFLDVYQHPNPADPHYQALLALYHKAIQPGGTSP